MKLGDLVKELIDNRGKNAEAYSNEGYAIIDSSMIRLSNGYVDLSTAQKHINDEIHDSFIRGDLKKDDLVITLVGNIGEVAIVPEGKCVIIQNQIGIRLTNNALPWFVYYQLLHKNDEIKMMNTSAVQPSVKKGNLFNLEMKLPSVEEQEIIVKKLDEIRQLIIYRKKQLEDLDEYIKSKYFEMFGDPINNQKDFPLETVNDVITFQGGAQPEKKYFEYEKSDSNIRLIQIRDYKTEQYLTYIPIELARRTCTATDIMIGRYGPPIFQILDGIEGAYNVALMKAIPKKGNKEFIRQFLKQECLFKYIDGLSQRTGGQTGIDMEKLKAYPFPYPPEELQDEFEKIITDIKGIKKRIENSLKDLEYMYNKKMHEYFD